MQVVMGNYARMQTWTAFNSSFAICFELLIFFSNNVLKILRQL